MAGFHKGDAMALPFPARSFGAAIMALVIYFVPEPAKAVVESEVERGSVDFDDFRGSGDTRRSRPGRCSRRCQPVDDRPASRHGFVRTFKTRRRRPRELPGFLPNAIRGRVPG